MLRVERERQSVKVKSRKSARKDKGTIKQKKNWKQSATQRIVLINNGSVMDKRETNKHGKK